MDDARVNPLTEEQIYFVRRSIREWLEIRLEHGHKQDWLKEFSANVPQFLADVDHSALLFRLLSGKRPFTDRPPTSMSYPNYELCEREGWEVRE